MGGGCKLSQGVGALKREGDWKPLMNKANRNSLFDRWLFLEGWLELKLHQIFYFNILVIEQQCSGIFDTIFFVRSAKYHAKLEISQRFAKNHFSKEIFPLKKLQPNETCQKFTIANPSNIRELFFGILLLSHIRAC